MRRVVVIPSYIVAAVCMISSSVYPHPFGSSCNLASALETNEGTAVPFAFATNRVSCGVKSDRMEVQSAPYPSSQSRRVQRSAGGKAPSIPLLVS